MKCLFAMRFYSLIWHINEEAFGVRQRLEEATDGRDAAPPHNKPCTVLPAASLHCQPAGSSGASVCSREKHPPFPRKERTNNSTLSGSSYPALLAPRGSSSPQHGGRDRPGGGGGWRGKGDASRRMQKWLGTILT